MIVSCNKATMQQKNNATKKQGNIMKEKSYRVYCELTEKAQDKKLEYIVEKKTEISERDLINALIAKGLETATTEDIENFMNSLGK